MLRSVSCTVFFAHNKDFSLMLFICCICLRLYGQLAPRHPPLRFFASNIMIFYPPPRNFFYIICCFFCIWTRMTRRRMVAEVLTHEGEKWRRSEGRGLNRKETSRLTSFARNDRINLPAARNAEGRTVPCHPERAQRVERSGCRRPIIASAAHRC